MFYASVAMFLEVKFSLVAVWVEENSAQFLFRLVYVYLWNDLIICFYYYFIIFEIHSSGAVILMLIP